MDYESESIVMNKGFIGAIKDGKIGERAAIVWKKMFRDESLISKQNKANQSANDALLKYNDFSKQEQNLTNEKRTTIPRNSVSPYENLYRTDMHSGVL